MTINRAASVHSRLLNLSKELNEDFNLTLNRYALERYLYRLSISKYNHQYVLKGAMLFAVWFDAPYRPTLDADFLGLGPNDQQTEAEVISEICNISVDDGVVFDSTSIQMEDIREDNFYGGLRVKVPGTLGNARLLLRLDIGFGDAVTPGPEEVNYPVLLADLPAPRIRAYPRATVVAEKLEAIAKLGMVNSRMKDYYDLRAIVLEGAIDPGELARAIVRTFNQRRTSLPNQMLVGLTDEFAQDSTILKRWKAYLDKNGFEYVSLQNVIADIRGLIDEPLLLACKRVEED